MSTNSMYETSGDRCLICW